MSLSPEGTSPSQMPDPMKESHIRSILKALSWRIVASVTTIIVAYIVSGEVSVAFTIGFGEFFAKLLIYYAHERVWQGLPRGTVRRVFRK